MRNTFQPGDKLVIDSGNASVVLNDKEAMSIGNIANDWSNMELCSDSQVVYVSYSDWIESGYEPTVKMFYRERWL